MPAYVGTKFTKAQAIEAVRRNIDLARARWVEKPARCDAFVALGEHHADPMEVIGVPSELAALEYMICEGLEEFGSPGAGRAWPEKFLMAIPEGADLDGVWARMALWLLRAIPRGSDSEVLAIVADAERVIADLVELGGIDEDEADEVRGRADALRGERSPKRDDFADEEAYWGARWKASPMTCAMDAVAAILKNPDEGAEFGPDNVAEVVAVRACETGGDEAMNQALMRFWTGLAAEFLRALEAVG